MKISLILPPLSKDVLYGEWDLSGVDSISPPLGLLSLAASIRMAGHDVQLIDAYANKHCYSSVCTKIMEFNPNVIGISCMTPGFVSATALSRDLKETFPKKIFILGGTHITALPEESMKESKIFDYGVIAEGEVTIVELLDAVGHGKSVENVDGIIYWKNGELIRTNPRNFINDLDVLPFPAWDLLPSLTDPYRLSVVGTTDSKSTSLLTSRGCPCRCTFCDVGGVGNKVRAFSSNYVIGMIEHLKDNYGISDFLFYDDAFTTRKKRTIEICSEIIRKKLKISWSCCARVDCVSPEMLRLMKAAGCWQIEYGIESGSQQILDFMQKKITLNQVRQALKWTKSAGITSRGNFIFGYLNDTKDTLEETIRFALDIDLDYFQQTFLSPFPGSEIYSVAEQYGSFDKDPQKMNNITINFVPNGMTADDLRHYSRKAFRKFYFRPKIIFNIIRRITGFKDISRLSSAFCTFLKSAVLKRSKLSLSASYNENTIN